MNNELLEQFIEETNLDEDAYNEILNYNYTEDEIERIFIDNGDYSIYYYNDMEDLGEQLFELYECVEHVLPSHLQDYFDYEKYAEDFIDGQEVIELSDTCLIVIY